MRIQLLIYIIVIIYIYFTFEKDTYAQPTKSHLRLHKLYTLRKEKVEVLLLGSVRDSKLFKKKVVEEEGE